MGYVDDYLGGYENLAMHGWDFEAAYESQIPDCEFEYGDFFDYTSRPKATKPSRFRAPKSNQTQRARAAAANAGITNNSAEPGPSAGQSLPAASAASAFQLRASTTGNPPIWRAPAPVGSVRSQLPEFFERMTQAELRPVFKEKHMPYTNIWTVTIQLMLLTSRKRKVWGTVEGTGKTVREARQAAAQEADRLVETSGRGAASLEGAAAGGSTGAAAGTAGSAL